MTDSVRVTHPVPAPEPASHARSVRVLGWLSAAGIGAALLIMIGASLVRQDWMFPRVPMPAIGPPWELRGLHVLPGAVDVALWIGALLGGCGVVAGLVAASKGARPPMRLIVVAAIVAVAALTVLPPAGSSDPLDYATYGRLLVLGHNPYVTTPHFLRAMHNTFAHSVPHEWQKQVSLYGPFATLEQFVAARIGGTSAARIVFWLKLWNSLAFGAVALVLDRLLRGNPARRLRAHLLWTVNPLLLWGLIASGHVDMLAAAAGLLGLLAIGRQSPDTPPRLGRALAAGALVGVAADIKINYVLFGIGLAWALRRQPRALLTAAAGALAVLIPSYSWFGTPAIRALLGRRDATSADTIYQIFYHPIGHLRHLVALAVLLFIVLTVLLLRRMPAGDPLRPALRPALAISLAWLFIWPYQLPWYDAIIICVLVLYPASRLDWLVIARLTFATISNIPGNPKGPSDHVLRVIDRILIHWVAPYVLLAAAVGLIALAVSGRWGLRGSSPPAQNIGSATSPSPASAAGQPRSTPG
jgi:hypothetical protein